jgi:hypothetical protein
LSALRQFFVTFVCFDLIHFYIITLRFCEDIFLDGAFEVPETIAIENDDFGGNCVRLAFVGQTVHDRLCGNVPPRCGLHSYRPATDRSLDYPGDQPWPGSALLSPTFFKKL